MRKLWVQCVYYIGMTLLYYYREAKFHIDELRGRLDNSALQFLNAKFKLTPFVSYISKVVDDLKLHNEYRDNERIDVPLYPAQFFYRKAGNCNDFSFAIMCLLEKYRNSYYCEMMIVRSKSDDRGHAVCAIFDPLRRAWIHASNWGVFFVDAKTREELAKTVYPDAEYFVTYDSNLSILDIKFL